MVGPTSLATRRGLRPPPAAAAAVVAAIAIAMALAPSPLVAQFPPDSLTNLRVLQEDIAFRDLMDTMRGFTRALGIRCSHCHVGEEGQPLAEYDFASDEVPLKGKAREMLRMVRAINTEHLAGLGERSDPPVAVQCFTCHRGTRVPRPLQAELRLAYDAGGVDALVDRYHELRAEYYGHAAYDFGPAPLADVGTALVATDPDAAVTVLRLNAELFPDSWQAHFNVGAALQAAGDREGAMAAYRRSLELNPGNREARQRLEALREAGDPGS